MRPQLSGLLLLGVLGLSLVLALPSADAGYTRLVPRNSLTNPGITIKTKYGYMNATNSQIYSTGPNANSDGSIVFAPAGFETVQVVYRFTVVSFGNGTLTVRFIGSQPYRIVASSAASSVYDTANRWEQFTFTTSATDPSFSVAYAGVSTSLDNAITVGVGLFTINLSLIMIGFILMVMGRFWRKDEEPEGVNRVTYYGFGIIIAAVLALGTLAIIGAFDPFFRALGI